jgi:hypothetical protein
VAQEGILIVQGARAGVVLARDASSYGSLVLLVVRTRGLLVLWATGLWASTMILVTTGWA